MIPLQLLVLVFFAVYQVSGRFEHDAIVRTLQSIQPSTIRINAGASKRMNDTNGNTWDIDRFFGSKGTVTSSCPMEIIGTNLDFLYCNARQFNVSNETAPFRYDIPVPRNGTYTVKLYFAETVLRAKGVRTFDVLVGGSLAVSELDIFALVGYGAALNIPIVTTARSNRRILIDFVPKKMFPIISAIEVIETITLVPTKSPTKQQTMVPTRTPTKVPTRTQTKIPSKIPTKVPTKSPLKVPVATTPTAIPFVMRISSGSNATWVDSTGVIWEKDKFFNASGAVYSACPFEINGTTIDGLYCKERFFNPLRHKAPFRYTIQVPRNRTYMVKLHFSEIFYKRVGERKFSIWIDGSLVMKSLDIFAEVGFAAALIIPYVTHSISGSLQIELIPEKGNAKICAVEVIETSEIIAPSFAPVSTPIVPFRKSISAGATEDWVDSEGVRWESDKYFNSKGATHWMCPLEINNTILDSLYCKERYFNMWEFNAPFSYDVPVPRNGTYSVILHFAEISHHEVGKRVFGVLVGGKVVFRTLDIFKEVGYATALVVPFISNTKNGYISIQLIPRIENPKISAIEVLELPNYIAPPTPAPVFEARISAGATEDWEDSNGFLWESDKFYDGKGAVFGFCPAEINGTDLDNLYCKERYFNKWIHKAPFVYQIPVPRTGSYSVKLHFAEVVHNIQGARIFDVLINGKVVLGSLDIFAEVGFMQAFVLSAIAQTSNGFISIEFISKVENPKICAIEIVELPDYIPPPTQAPVVRPFEVLINAGAVDDFTERNSGRTWTADKYFIGGGVLFRRHYDVQWTINDEVYYLERNGEFRYEVPVPSATYEILLHFTELHWEYPGLRRFDVRIEDDMYFKDIDIIKMTGGIRRAMSLQHTLVVTDGLLSLEFLYASPRVDMPKVSGIEVRFLNSSTEKTSEFPLRINCGGDEFTDITSGLVWRADRHFVVGYIYITGDTRIISNETNKVYHTSRYRDFNYEIPASPGTYEVTLYFAESYFTQIGERVFNITMEDVLTFRDVDLIKLGKGKVFTKIELKSQVYVTDGLLTIKFQNDATVNGIEVKLLRPATTAPIIAPTRSPSRAPIFIPNGAPALLPTVSPPRKCTVPRLTSSWTAPYAPYPLIVAEPAGDMIGNDFVIFGGFTDGYSKATTETYALDTSIPGALWRRMDNIPFPNGLTHQGLVVIGKKAYLCGGYVGGSLGTHSDKCFVYDHSIPPGSGKQWTSIAPLPMGGRSGGAMIYDTTLNAIIYTGGAQRTVPGQPGAVDYKDTWMYSIHNPAAGWVTQAPMPFFGNHMNAVTVLDGSGKERHFIFGGQVGDYELTSNTATMYEYIATTDSWIKRTPMPFARGHATSAARPIGCGFIVAGGRTNKGLTGEITYYNVADDSWQSIGHLPVDIHTNVCVITKSGVLRCETGWISNTFSTETHIEL